MSYVKSECFSIVCDNCGEVYQDDHNGFSMFPLEEDAHQSADNDDWYLQGDDDKQYCPKCHKIEEDDIITVDESRKGLYIEGR